MSDKRFKVCIDSNNGVGLFDNSVKLLFVKFTNEEDALRCKDSLKHHCNLMNELYDENEQLKDENERLRFELETHKHPLLSTREAKKKIDKLSDSLADEVKRNGLLKKELNQLRIENMRLKKKGVNDVYSFESR